MFELLFFRNALIAVVLIATAAAIIGCYIVSRRMVALSGGVTHACFGGLGLGYYLGVNPVAMAAVFAVGASLGVEWASRNGRIRNDSAIAVVWALGMAIGVIFVFLTPGYVPELNSFLFGNILTVTMSDIWEYLIFLLALLLFMTFGFRTVVACAFDPAFAKVSGLKVDIVNTIMTVFTALCIVLTIRMVGIMLLMSMLAMPTLIAEPYCKRYATLMSSSVAVAVISSVGGIFLGTIVDVPASALIVVVMIAVYLLSTGIKHLVKLIRGNKDRVDNVL